MKKLDLRDVAKIEEGWFPKRMVFKDMVKNGRGMEFVIENITFNREIRERIYSKDALSK